MGTVKQVEGEVRGRRTRYAAPALKRHGDMRRLTAGTKGGVKGDGPDNPTGPKTRIVS